MEKLASTEAFAVDPVEEIARLIRRSGCSKEPTYLCSLHSYTSLSKKWARKLQRKGHKCGDLVTPIRGTPIKGVPHIALCHEHFNSAEVRWCLR